MNQTVELANDQSKIEIGSTAPPELDWEVLENSHPRSLRENRKAKTKGKDRVFSHEPYAQDLYERMFGKLEGLKEPSIGESITGKITSMNSESAFVDIGWREDALLDLRKENKDYLQYLNRGYEVEVLIERIDQKQKNPIQASYTKNILLRRKEELLNSIGEAVAYTGTVSEMVENAGFYVDIDGVKCFMPGSLGGMNKLVDFESLVGKKLYVVPINYSKEKNYIVVSHRDYLKTLIPTEIKKLEAGKRYEGFVTGTSRHGIFVEFNGCLTGLISTQDIEDETKERFTDRKLLPGEPIEFYVKDIISEEKIVLTQIDGDVSGWMDIDARYNIDTYVTGTIKKSSKFGLFVEIEPRIVGLLRKSYLDENDSFEVGQEIEVMIKKIDKEGKKIDFAI